MPLYKLYKRNTWWTPLFNLSEPSMLYWNEKTKCYDVGSRTTAKKNGKYWFDEDEVAQLERAYPDLYIHFEKKEAKIYAPRKNVKDEHGKTED